MLSTYNSILSSVPFKPNPIILGSFLIKITKGSTTKLNNKGEKGPHCLVILVYGNKLELSLFIQTVATESKYNNQTILIYLPPIQNLFNTDNRNPHSTLPIAFIASKEKTGWSRDPSPSEFAYYQIPILYPSLKFLYNKDIG